MTSQTEQKVRDIIAQHFGVDREQVTDEASLVNDLGANDLDRTELVMALEYEFNLSIPDEVAKKITTVREAIECIERYY